MKEKLRNIGPKTGPWLEKVGIQRRADLQKIGAQKAYEKIIAAGYPRNKNLLYALIGAEEDKSWSEVVAVLKYGRYDR